MNFEEKAKAVLELIYSDFGQSGGIDVLTLVDEFRAIRNAALEEAAKAAEEFADGWPMTAEKLGNRIRALKGEQ